MPTFPRPARVTRAYQAAYSVALFAKAGDTLTPGRRDEEFPGWVWCTNAVDTGGWTPEAWLDIQGKQAILLRDYSSAELSVQPDDRLTLLAEESGWYWALDAGGQYGWLPADCVDAG